MVWRSRWSRSHWAAVNKLNKCIKAAGRRVNICKCKSKSIDKVSFLRQTPRAEVKGQRQLSVPLQWSWMMKSTEFIHWTSRDLMFDSVLIQNLKVSSVFSFMSHQRQTTQGFISHLHQQSQLSERSVGHSEFTCWTHRHTEHKTCWTAVKRVQHHPVCSVTRSETTSEPLRQDRHCRGLTGRITYS